MNSVIPLTIDEIRGDVAVALVEQGFELRDARDAANGANGNDFATVFRSALEWANAKRRNGSALSKAAPATTATTAKHGDAPVPAKVQPMKPKTEKRICAGYERACTNELGARNSTGLCLACYGRKSYHEKRGSPRKAKPARAARIKTNGHAPTPATAPAVMERVALEVNEQQLDRFLTGLPLAAKRALAQSWLSGETAE